MICVGIDVSKGKSTVCIMENMGDVLEKPFEVVHTQPALEELAEKIRSFNKPVRIVMEATGHYHLPVSMFLEEKGFWVCVENALVMKRFLGSSLHGGKTDPMDAKKIAWYGLVHWKDLKQYKPEQETYAELRFLLGQYYHAMKMFVLAKQNLICLMDRTMPGFKKALDSRSNLDYRKVKYKDFALKYRDMERIKGMGKENFVRSYERWCRKEKYQFSREKACELYCLAETGIVTLPSKPAFSDTVVQMAAQEVTTMGEILNTIVSQMQELAKTLPEYSVVREMPGMGDVLCPCMIAAVGDVRRFYSGKALVAYAGLDAPPYESGQFVGTRRKISKRGSRYVRKIGYEIMTSLKSHPPKEDTAVYDFIIKKEKEGKAKVVANIAGLNKFLHIYYARVNALYQELEERERKTA